MARIMDFFLTVAHITDPNGHEFIIVSDDLIV